MGDNIFFSDFYDDRPGTMSKPILVSINRSNRKGFSFTLRINYKEYQCHIFGARDKNSLYLSCKYYNTYKCRFKAKLKILKFYNDFDPRFTHIENYQIMERKPQHTYQHTCDHMRNVENQEPGLKLIKICPQ